MENIIFMRSVYFFIFFIWLYEFEELDETSVSWSKCLLKLQAGDSVMQWLLQLESDQDILGSNPTFPKILFIKFT